MSFVQGLTLHVLPLQAGSPRPPRSPKTARLAGSSSPELFTSKPRHPSDPGTSPDSSQQALSGVDGDIKQAFGEQDVNHTGARNLRSDLLHAADSVTNAMSSLVKELNSGKKLSMYTEYFYKNHKISCEPHDS